MEDAERQGERDVELEVDAPPSARGRRLVVVNALIVATALVVGFVLARGGGDEQVTEPTDPSTVPTSSRAPTAQELMAILPASPIDGKQSWKLPVAVTPQAQVVDGQVVTVVGKGFARQESVGAVMCAAEAAVDGVAACDLGSRTGTYDHVTYATSTLEGFVQVDVVLRQVITTPNIGVVDCASAAERCLIGLGAVSDYDRSGGSFVAFAGAPPFPLPSMGIEPAGPLAPDQAVTVHGVGLVPPREVQVEQCRDDHCTVLARGRVGPEGTFAAPVVVRPAFLADDGTDVVCDEGCVVRVGGIGIPGTTSAPVPAPVAITFAAVREPVTTVPVPEAPHDTTAVAAPIAPPAPTGAVPLDTVVATTVG